MTNQIIRGIPNIGGKKEMGSMGIIKGKCDCSFWDPIMSWP